MANPFGIPETDPSTVAARLKQGDGDAFVLLDVRELPELKIANLGDGVVHWPLSRIAAQQLSAIPAELTDKEQEIVVFCHHGGRSAQVAAYLRANGWQNVVNLAGGIHLWALQVDPSIATY